MIELQGKYASAKVFTDNIEQTAIGQIIELLNQPFVKGCKIRIMSDVHAGAGCVIGFTADFKDMVIPNLIGVDIGCGMFVIDITEFGIDLKALNEFVHTSIPVGPSTHESAMSGYNEFEKIICYPELRNSGKFQKAIGTLGGGNHFIEVDYSDKTGKTYLVIHTGSRNLGKQVADYYQKMAISTWKINGLDYKEHREKLIAGCRAEKRGYDIPAVLKRFDDDYKAARPQYPAELCFLFGDKLKNYLHDMKLCQEYAVENRTLIAKLILHHFDVDLKGTDSFQTIHNYINFDDGIMRKGAVSAQKGERLIIPMNMRDGSLLCVGKGNADWNFSAPHGAGRIMSRAQAKRDIKMDDYKNSMDGIYTTCVNENTLDESPMAYKPMAEIIANIGDTVEIVDIIRPLWNFKDAKGKEER